MSSQSIRAIIFDIGGVLEIAPQRMTISDRWETRLGLPPGEINARMEDVWRGGAIGAITEADVHRSLEGRLGLSSAQVTEFMADLWTEYLGTLNTELAAYLGALRPRYATGILSNSFVGAREREQERYGFADLTDHIAYSHEIGMSKPDPRTYRLVCERLAVRPEQAIFVDDAERCVEGARAIGMHGVHFRSNAQAIAEIDALLSR
ncbi:HAD family phosphatase [Nonomuraea sp. NPDC005983]|uniref:HAD family hydrolase n=1 Tax=Nonomuraea sp. NPDC005983 TaxID=3155595 RepID=UPI0033B166D1